MFGCVNKAEAVIGIREGDPSPPPAAQDAQRLRVKLELAVAHHQVRQRFRLVDVEPITRSPGF